MGTESEYAPYIHPYHSDIARQLAETIMRVSTALGRLEGRFGNTFNDIGARFYEDHFLAEYSTPEQTNPRDATIHDILGEEIAIDGFKRAIQHGIDKCDWPANAHYELSKKSSGQVLDENPEPIPEIIGMKDRRALEDEEVYYPLTSRGMHENHQVLRERFGDLESGTEPVLSLAAYNISRWPLIGSGGFINDTYWVAPRAYTFRRHTSTDTTRMRPIVNTREESLATDDTTYQRIHNIASEGNVSPWQTHMKLGTAALLYKAMEGGVSIRDLCPVDQIKAMRIFGADTTLREKVALHGGKVMDSLEIQREIKRRVAPYVSEYWEVEVLEEWGIMLHALELWRDQKKVTKPLLSLDWFFKQHLIDRDKGGDPRHVDMNYAMVIDNTGKKGTGYSYRDRGIFRLTPDIDISIATAHELPNSRRARMRGRVVCSPVLNRSPLVAIPDYVDWKYYNLANKRGVFPDHPTEQEEREFMASIEQLERLHAYRSA